MADELFVLRIALKPHNLLCQGMTASEPIMVSPERG